IDRAIDGYLEIGMFIDAGLRQQSELNLNAFERAAGRTLTAGERDEMLVQQHQAARWTYLGSGMTHPRFRETLGAISPAARDRIDAVAPRFS
ncbi:MAG: hypothetical protein ABW128_19000, partial [Rhizorhabdus sp.]